MKALIHNHGGEPCGKVALFIAGKAVSGEPIRASDVTLLDGTQPQGGGALPVCGACGTAVAFVVGDIVSLDVGYTYT